MILADFNDGAYKTVLLFHIIAAIIAMAPTIIHPILFRLEKSRPDPDPVALAQRVVAPSRIYVIALVLAGILGIGLISMGDPVLSWGDSWIWLGLVFWIALNGVFHALVLPAERSLAGGDTTALAKLDRFVPLLGVLFLLTLYLMVVKPGADGI